MVDRCALDLVLEFLLGKDSLRKYKLVNPWLRLTSIHDTRGAGEAAVALGVDARTYSLMRSPIERLMLARFSEAAIIYPDSTLHAEMREIGRLLLNQSLDLDHQYAALSALPGPIEHRGVRVWDVRPAFKSGELDSFGVVNAFATTNSVDVIISHNFRRNATGLFRSDWASGRVDFTRLDGHPLLLDAHRNGFYAVLKAGARDHEILEAIRIAATPQAPSEAKEG